MLASVVLDKVSRNSSVGIVPVPYILNLRRKRPRKALMVRLATLFIQLTWLLFQVQGYFIGPSCSKYGSEEWDLVELIKSAMKEAESMAELGKDIIKLQLDEKDDSKSLLFPDAEERHLQQIQGMYAKESEDKQVPVETAQ
jgi:hypothetical protein